MQTADNTSFKQVAFTHFVPCFFLGVISLFFVEAVVPDMELSLLLNDRIDAVDFVISALNGLFVAIMVAMFHWLRNRRADELPWIAASRPGKKALFYRIVIGFLGGSIDILFGLRNEGIMVLTGVVLFILVWHLRLFSRTMVRMLKPDSHATWSDVAELMRIYMTMLAGFTLVNASLEVAHILAGTPEPFGFGHAEGELFLNALYYTVVSMTTLGFGDIVPVTWDGKLLLIFQCLVSYVMFALMIGIVTRGVTDSNDLPGV